MGNTITKIKVIHHTDADGYGAGAVMHFWFKRLIHRQIRNMTEINIDIEAEIKQTVDADNVVVKQRLIELNTNHIAFLRNLYNNSITFESYGYSV